MNEETENAYEILDLPTSTTTTASEIRNAYIRQVRKWHPDLGRTEQDVQARTLRMFKLNAAYAILQDPHKRAEHDQDLRFCREHGVSNLRSKNRGSGYNQNDFDFSNKPRPSGLATPYRGSRSNMETHGCKSDGAHGQDGSPGTRGFEGIGHGGHGQSGTNAGPATAGEHAGDMKIQLRVSVARGGDFLEVDIHHVRLMNELVDPTQNNMRSVPLKVFGALEWSAVGGKGGAGGMGGDGGGGARGYPGRDATSVSWGTNGGPGGNGGDGGVGTHGADGGRGGDVQILLDQDDSYLLMRVEGCHPRYGAESQISGGRGGPAGRHGQGGAGGPGGRGGSSYSWTESRNVSRYNSNTGRYEYQLETTYHSNPGGHSGISGRRGRTPTAPLCPGKNGLNGSFVIKLKHADGKEYSYPARYNLEFDSVVTEQLSNMKDAKTFEFGESVMVPKIKVKNTGKMESPKQRVLIRFGTVEGVDWDSSGRIFLREGTRVPQGATAYADEGCLQFTCPYPRMAYDTESSVSSAVNKVTDFDPIVKSPTFLYRAYQLGHENRTRDDAQISDFQARYTDFQSETDVIHLAYPVENPDGIRGFRSLAPKETSIVEMTIRSTSNQEFGKLSKTGRALFAQLYYADDQAYEIPIDNITVRAEDGKKVVVTPSLTTRGKGYRYDIPSLPAQGAFTVQLSFKLDSTAIQVSEKAGLQVDLYLQKIPKLSLSGESEFQTKMHLVQRRIFVATCQPRFKPKQKCDVILVTTTSSSASQVSAWQSLVRALGFRWQPYSLSRYGHLSPGTAVEGIQLKDAFADKLVVILNDDYVPIPNVKSADRKKCRPSRLLKSAYEYPSSTKFLVVGGTTESVRHLSPAASALNTACIPNKSHPNVKTCREDVMTRLEDQRTNGFGLDRQTPMSFDICVKKKFLRQPTPSKISQATKNRAEKMACWFKKMDPLRPYEVTWTQLVQAVQTKEGWPSSTWEIGNLHVRVGPPRSQNAFSFVEEHKVSVVTPGKLTEPSIIRSKSMMYALLHASSFRSMMGCCCRKLTEAAKYPDETPRCEEVLDVIKDCLVGDFILDITNFYHGRLSVKDAISRSSTIYQLRHCESLNDLLEKSDSDEALQSTLKKYLSALVGALRSTARTKDLRPWWKPLSRKFHSGRRMVQALNALEEHWAAVLDEEIIVAEKRSLKDRVKTSIKERKKSNFAMISIRGRSRATLAQLHSPRNAESYQTSFRTVRVRRESEVLAGDTLKIKKFQPRTLDASESITEQSESHAADTYRTSIRQTAAAEYNLYVRTED